MITPADRALKKFLLDALRRDDASTFCTMLDAQPGGWPSYSQWSDYELLVRAVHHNCKRIAYLLLEKRARIFKRARVNSPLHVAAARPGWTDFVNVLLKRGARVAEVNNKGDTAIHIAFMQGMCTEILDLLLTVHMMNREENIVSDGVSLLHIACTRPNLTVVKTMLKQSKMGVNVQVPLTSSSKYAGFTPLHFAVSFGQNGVIDLLLDEFNADVYIQDANGSTPLHLAAERRDIAIIDRILRSEKRYEDWQNKFGLSHFAAACLGSNETIVEDYLRLAPSKSWSDPDTLVRSQVQHQEDYPNAGYTPLHFAAEFRRYNTAKLLLQYGAKCCATTATNATPFALAYKQSHSDVCELLCEYCKDASKGPSKKRKRDEIERSKIFESRFIDFGEILKRRKMSSSVGSDESTLTADSIFYLDSVNVNDSAVIDPLMLCVNPSKVFADEDPSSILKKSMVFDYYDDVYENMDESSLGLKGDHLICGQGAWNFRVNFENDYPSVKMPKDVNLNFYEPLDDVLNDIILDNGFAVVCNEQSAIKDCLSVNVCNDVVRNLEEPSVEILTDESDIDILSDDVSKHDKLTLEEPSAHIFADKSAVEDCLSFNVSEDIEFHFEEYFAQILANDSTVKNCLSFDMSTDTKLNLEKPSVQILTDESNKDIPSVDMSKDIELNLEKLSVQILAAESAVKSCVSVDVSNHTELNLEEESSANIFTDESTGKNCLSLHVAKDVELNLEKTSVQIPVAEPGVESCVSVDVSKDVELNLEVSSTQIVVKESTVLDCLFVDKFKDVELNLEKSSVQILADESAAKSCVSVDESKSVELNFEKPTTQIINCNCGNLKVNSVDEQVEFDKLFEKYLRDEKSEKHDDCDSSFVNVFDQSMELEQCSLVQETEKKLNDSDSYVTDGSNETVEISNSSSKSGILEETTKSSILSDDSSTADAVSSDYESGCSNRNVGNDCDPDKSAVIESAKSDYFEKQVIEIISTDSDSNKSAPSSLGREVEVKFVEVEDFYSMYLEFPEEIRMKYQDYEKDEFEGESDCDSSSDSSNCSTTASFAIELNENIVNFNNFLDTSSAPQSPVSSLSLFQLSSASDGQLVINSKTNSSSTVDFSRY